MSQSREEVRAAIVALHRQGRRQVEIVRLLRVSQQLVSKAVKRFNEQGNNLDRPRSGRPCTADNVRNRELIRERIRRNFRRSMRKMAQDIGISEGSVRKIVKKRLQCKPLKLQKGQHLNDKICQVRKQRCAALKRSHTAQQHRRILFSDEKFFSVEQVYNVQNDRVLSPDAATANRRGRIIPRAQKPAGVMVWAGVTSDGKTPLIFVENGIKINANNYVNDILEAVVLPWSQQHYGDQPWTFQQDSAPAHRANTTQEWCRDNLPEFITAQEWPPYSPDLNPLDYSIWGILESKACATAHKSVDSLKRSLLRAWDEIDVNVLCGAVDQFPKRLNACVKANGGYFENDLL
jgi:transposase